MPQQSRLHSTLSRDELTKSKTRRRGTCPRSRGAAHARGLENREALPSRGLQGYVAIEEADSLIEEDGLAADQHFKPFIRKWRRREPRGLYYLVWMVLKTAEELCLFFAT